MSRNFFLLPQPLPEEEVSSSSCNGDCNKNVARHVNFRVCYTAQRSVKLVSQRLNEIARQVARKISQCNSGLTLETSGEHTIANINLFTVAKLYLINTTDKTKHSC